MADSEWKIRQDLKLICLKLNKRFLYMRVCAYMFTFRVSIQWLLFLCRIVSFIIIYKFLCLFITQEIWVIFLKNHLRHFLKRSIPIVYITRDIFKRYFRHLWTLFYHCKDRSIFFFFGKDENTRVLRLFTYFLLLYNIERWREKRERERD